MTDADVENQETTPENAASEEGLSAAEEAASASPSVDEWKTKAAYLAAEMDNMKKRFDREKSEFLRYANEELLKKFIPVMDNMLLAFSSVKGATNSGEQKPSEKLLESLLQGFEMTLKHFEKTLEGVGVEFVDAQRGTAFNPEHHEAMGQGSEADLEDGVICSEFQRGFKLNGRVIRPARVMVNKVPATETAQKDGE